MMFQCSFSILNMHIVSVSPTLTEWLWKSVTTISFLLFTATKCGPAISRGDKKGETRQERWVILCFSLHDRKFHTIFGLDWKRTTRRRRRDSLTWESVWDKTEAEKECAEIKKIKKKRKNNKYLSHSWGKHLLTEGRTRFTKLLFQCNVCTTLFYKKRKVPSERWYWKEGWVSELSPCNKRCTWKHSWRAGTFFEWRSKVGRN